MYFLKKISIIFKLSLNIEKTINVIECILMYINIIVEEL